MIAITIGTVDLHGSVQPLHSTIHNERLSSIIFSSGMLNNNMSLVFVMTLERLIQSNELLKGDEYIANFAKVCVLSIIFGLFIGGILSYTMRRGSFLSSNAILEVFYVVLGAYLTYMLAHLDFFKLSGDVAIFAYGYIVGHYTKYNMSLDGIKNVGLFLNFMYLGAEALTFVFVGVSIEDAIDTKFANVYMALFIILVALGCRFICAIVIAWTKR